MGIIRFKKKDGRAALGVRFANEVVDLGEAAPHLPTDMAALLAQGGSAAVREAIALAGRTSARIPYQGLELLPPAVTSIKTICLGLNYHDHAAEAKREVPTYPVVFFRSASSFIGHGQPMLLPRVSSMLDWEAELVAFVGKRARHVGEAQALEHIAGYSCFNDGSVRDYQRKTVQWTIGKNFDGTGGFGPEFVPADELPPGAAGLRIECRVNGQTMQSANTADMIFGVARTVALMSECMTLEPGDLLVMGTPGGVGVARTPPVFLKAGDVCEVEIENIGLLRNRVVAE
ncbi:MAG TPA: fumarylacetoacetate hydrolase family protein [Burkholderiaceae bacterium]|nr:fumarylacetoacetate hydrolase family protein [Burkholderiaceae bacterium]